MLMKNLKKPCFTYTILFITLIPDIIGWVEILSVMAGIKIYTDGSKMGNTLGAQT